MFIIHKIVDFHMNFPNLLSGIIPPSKMPDIGQLLLSCWSAMYQRIPQTMHAIIINFGCVPELYNTTKHTLVIRHGKITWILTRKLLDCVYMEKARSHKVSHLAEPLLIIENSGEESQFSLMVCPLVGQ